MGLPSNTNALQNGFAQGYQIGRSLRFRSSASAYLNRTPASSGTNLTKWTLSFWMKRGALNVQSVPFSAQDTPGTGASSIYFLIGSGNTIGVFYPNTGSTLNVGTAAVLRDPSAWYHIIFVWDTTQATSTDRIKIYINGVQQTLSGGGTFPSLNATTTWNTNCAHFISKNPVASSDYFDGYFAEIYNIDGQALTPSSFGLYDSNGIWQPIKYTGTYGTNGFYLPFSNTTSTTTLVADASGNGNNWTANNISLTSGTTYDSMIDSPTNSSASSNYAVLNPLSNSSALRNGNLNVYNASTYSYTGASTIAVSSGKWYCEFPIVTAYGYYPRIGILPATENPAGLFGPGYSSTSYGISAYDGSKYNNNSPVAYGTSYTNGDIIMCALDMDNGKVYWGKNGTWFDSGNPATQTNPAFTGLTGLYCFGAAVYLGECAANFGQRPFSYTPPSGYNALNTANLPQPLISNGANYMAATLWTGNGTSQSIANSQSNGGNNPLGKSFYPDFVWYKGRTTTYNHALFDTIRGTLQRLSSNLTSAETATAGSLTAFNSNGFSIGNDAGANQNTDTYVGWQWLAGAGTTSTNTSGSITSTVSANTTAGFSVVTYTNPSSGSSWTVGHGLGVAPSMFFTKQRSATSGWPVYHVSLGATNAIFLQSTNASAANTAFNNTAPTSSVLSFAGLGTNYDANATMVAYCFAAVRGYSAFGSYTGNGSADGPFIYTGFRPRWYLVKRSDAGAESWYLWDSSRDTYNVMQNTLQPNLSNAEAGGAARYFDALSNGFKCRSSDTAFNASGGTYIYAAFAENPFQIARAR